MNMSHCKVADILNKIFPGIEARAGYIGSDENPCFKIFTNIDIGMNQRLNIELPDGVVSAATIARVIGHVMMFNKATLSPAVAQMVTAVEYSEHC